MEKINKAVQKDEDNEIKQNENQIEDMNREILKSNNKIIRRNLERFKNKEIYIKIMSFMVIVIFLMGGVINRAKAVSIKEDKIVFSFMDDVEVSSENSENKSYEENNENSEVFKENNSYNNQNQIESKVKYKNTSDEGQKFIYDAVEVSKKLKNYDYQNGGKKIVFLTFDDGASNTVTPKILKILDNYNVKATFFIMGQVLEDGGENAKKLVKEEYDKGHAIGNHSYCHDYSVLYPGRNLDLEAFKNDYNKNENELKKILGEDFATRVIRCPGGYMSWNGMDKLDAYLDKNNMASIDWSALSGDAEGKKKNVDELLKYAVESAMNQEMVVMLMHDTYGK